MTRTKVECFESLIIRLTVGIYQALILISTTTLVTTITALSMSAISTNGIIKGKFPRDFPEAF